MVVCAAAMRSCLARWARRMPRTACRAYRSAAERTRRRRGGPRALHPPARRTLPCTATLKQSMRCAPRLTSPEHAHRQLLVACFRVLQTRTDSREGYRDMLVWAVQPEAIRCECAMQVKRNAASRLGQAIGQLARVSIHMSESEGHHAPRRHGRRHRKERKTEDAASGDDVSSQASASSATQQRLKARIPLLGYSTWCILCRLTPEDFEVCMPGR